MQKHSDDEMLDYKSDTTCSSSEEGGDIEEQKAERTKKKSMFLFMIRLKFHSNGTSLCDFLY